VRLEDRFSPSGIAIRRRPSAVWVVAVFVPATRAWITPSSEICSMILSLLILPPNKTWYVSTASWGVISHVVLFVAFGFAGGFKVKAQAEGPLYKALEIS
jgi:hypothetical protein